VHAHHDVRRVHQPREVWHVRVVVRLGDPHVELGRRGGARHGALVHEPARALAGDDEEPGPVLAPGRPRPRRHGAFQLERAAEHALEVGHRLATGGPRRVDAHGAVEGGADDDPREAVHLAVVVHVDDVVAGELAEEGLELVGPPVLDVGEQELDLPAEVVRGREERHQHVGVVVVEVAREPAAGEEETRDGVVPRAERRDDGAVGGAGTEGDERELADVVHGHRVVQARVRLGLPLAGQRADVDPRVVAVHADVAHGGAPLGALAGVVAGRAGRVEVLLADGA